jgi:hypothetical protein
MSQNIHFQWDRRKAAQTYAGRGVISKVLSRNGLHGCSLSLSRTWLAEGRCGLLQVKQSGTGALKWDATGGESGEDLVERRLDLGDRFHRREAGTEDVGAADGSGGVLTALVIAVMEVTEFLAAQSGRATEDAIFFEMVASTKGHRVSEKQLATSN